MTNIEKENSIALSMLKMSFLNKSAFKGSHKGMRYIIKKEEIKDGDDNKNVLRVHTYKDLYNFENSKDITTKDFEYSEAGIKEALEYLDEKVKDYG